jgi:hypothetical protein
MCDIFDYTNVVKTATCHTKNANPTLIDVILTNEYALFTSSSAIWFSKFTDCRSLKKKIMIKIFKAFIQNNFFLHFGT